MPSPGSVIAGARVRSQASPHGTCGGKKCPLYLFYSEYCERLAGEFFFFF